MGGHGHQEAYHIPHPSIYKVENIPQLKKVQESLARQGLSDPWLRNEVWRFEPKHFGTHRSRFMMFFFRGITLGFAAFVATIGAEYVLFKDDTHSHGHNEEKSHH